MGCLFRKRNDFLKATNAFTKAAEGYAAAYGSSDKRVVESTKRARAMAGKLAEGAAPSRVPRSGASTISTVME